MYVARPGPLQFPKPINKTDPIPYAVTSRIHRTVHSVSEVNDGSPEGVSGDPACGGTES